MFSSIPPLLLVALSCCSATQASALPASNMARQVTFDCPADGLFPYTRDNTYYYNCYDGIAQLQRCPPGSVFDPNTSMCVDELEVKTDLGTRNIVARQEDRECPALNGLFPADDPSLYYLCVNGFAFLQACATGQFNPDTKLCEEAVPSPTTSKTARDEVFDCPNEEGAFPYPGDPSKFWLCVDGRAFVGLCQSPATFNPDTEMCELPPATESTRRNMARQDTFTCPAEDDIYPDPKDRTQYYVCSDGVATPGFCSENHFFDPATGECVFECPTSEGVFANPAYPRTYYVCQGGTPTLEYCDGQYYDPLLQSCVDTLIHIHARRE